MSRASTQPSATDYSAVAGASATVHSWETTMKARITVEVSIDGQWLRLVLLVALFVL